VRVALAAAVRRSAAVIEAARRSRIVASFEIPVSAAWWTRAVPWKKAALGRPVRVRSWASIAFGSLIVDPSRSRLEVTPAVLQVRVSRPLRGPVGTGGW